jgi:hypothetical protein
MLSPCVRGETQAALHWQSCHHPHPAR